MRLLVLTYYFQPDLCAGSFRSTALVNALAQCAPQGCEIDVVTTLPNRYRSFTPGVPAGERRDNVAIHRIPVSEHASGMFDQSRSFAQFAIGAWRMTRHRQYDLVFATSSRLMTAVLGAAISSRESQPLYLDIRDIFVDTIGDVLPRGAVWLAKPFFSALERFAVTRAIGVNLVSEGFTEYFRSRYPSSRLTFFSNGIDPEFLQESVTPTVDVAPGDPLTVLYAGNIGEGQGLHLIVPPLARRLLGRAVLRVIGDGGRRAQLEKALVAAGSSNVTLVPPMIRDKLIEEYRSADILFMHLNAHSAFRKVLPSKIFEYAATGKPILAGVAGHAAQFLRDNVENAAVFRPCDVDDAVRAMDTLSLKSVSRSDFVKRFARDAVAREMAQDVSLLARARGLAPG